MPADRGSGFRGSGVGGDVPRTECVPGGVGIGDWARQVAEQTRAAVDCLECRRPQYDYRRDALVRHVQPAVKICILGEQFLHRGIGFVDVPRLARESAPAERADTLSEQGADISRNRAR